MERVSLFALVVHAAAAVAVIEKTCNPLVSKASLDLVSLYAWRDSFFGEILPWFFVGVVAQVGEIH